MKHFTKLVFTVLIGGMLYGCGHEANHESHSKSKHEGTHKAEEGKLVLDHGKKWQANAETTTGVLNMIQFVNEFTDQENPEAYKELGILLSNEFGLIFKNCTMKGEAHNQLHNFLLPMKESFEVFSAGDLIKQKAEISKLKTHLEQYDMFFE